MRKITNVFVLRFSILMCLFLIISCTEKLNLSNKFENNETAQSNNQAAIKFLNEEYCLKFDVRIVQKENQDLLISFTDNNDDFVSIEEVSNKLIKQFPLFIGTEGEAFNFTTFDLTKRPINELYQKINSATPSLISFLIFDELPSSGQLYLNGNFNKSLNFSSNESTFSSELLAHIYASSKEVIAVNKTSDEILRVFMSNMYMGLPIDDSFEE